MCTRAPVTEAGAHFAGERNGLGPSACIPLYSYATPRSRSSGLASNTETALFDGALAVGYDSDAIYVQQIAKRSIRVCLGYAYDYISIRVLVY